MDLSKYKNIFGEPGKGVHSYRIFNIAIVDVVLTILFAWFVSKYYKISFLWSCVALFSLGIFAHHLFGVRTTVDKTIFPDG
jgi:hypothetical protein